MQLGLSSLRVNTRKPGNGLRPSSVFAACPLLPCSGVVAIGLPVTITLWFTCSARLTALEVSFQVVPF